MNSLTINIYINPNLPILKPMLSTLRHRRLMGFIKRGDHGVGGGVTLDPCTGLSSTQLTVLRDWR